MNDKTIGFVGTGRMGGPMAGRLLDAGYDLVVFDPSPAALAPLVERGARKAASPAEVGAAARIVFVSLPTPDVVKAVALGADGLSSGGAMRIFVDLSTTGPRAEAEVARALKEKGVDTVDCPVSGGVAGARKGTLAMMAAGRTEVFETVKPMLLNLGKVFHVGQEPGMAQTMKVINNMASVAALAISSEVMVMGAKAGLDADVMIDVLNAGSGRNSATTDKIPNFVLPRTFDFGFAVGLSSKDIRLCLDEAEALGVPMIVGSAVRQLLTITREKFGADADMTNMVRTVEEWAGAEVRGKAAKA